METKELKIQVPKGYEIDEENSTFDCIKFKPIKNKLTYDDITKNLFLNKRTYVAGRFLNYYPFGTDNYKLPNLCASEKQAQKLLAINKLMNVAKYLNGDWKPDWSNYIEKKYYFILKSDNNIGSGFRDTNNQNIVYFRTYKLLEQTIEILGEDTIRLALSTDW